MAGKVRTWVWVVVGLAIACVLGMIAMAGIGFYFFSRHISTSEASPKSAATQFDQVLERFGSKKPLIELDERGEFLRGNPARQASPNARAPESLQVMAFDAADGRIVRVTVPFWLLRMRSGETTIDFNGRRMNLEDLKLTVRELERLGPALIINHRGASGDRVLVWSQ